MDVYSILSDILDIVPDEETVLKNRILKALDYLENLEPVFVLKEEETKALEDYFINRAGWISHEFDSKVHELVTRLIEFNKR